MKLKKIKFLSEVRQPEYAQILKAAAENLAFEARGGSDDADAWYRWLLTNISAAISDGADENEATQGIVDECNYFVKILNKEGKI